MRSQILADDDYRWPGVVKELLSQAPDNLMVVADVARNAGDAIAPYKALLLATRRSSPTTFWRPWL